jgi:hypothetical protein
MSALCLANIEVRPYPEIPANFSGDDNIGQFFCRMDIPHRQVRDLLLIIAQHFIGQSDILVYEIPHRDAVVRMLKDRSNCGFGFL